MIRTPCWHNKHDFNFNNVEIMELKFLRHGCPRSKYTTTGELWDSGPLREQQDTETARIEMRQSQLLKTKQSQRSSMLAHPVDLIAWWRLAVCSRNVTISITRDYVVRQTKKYFINVEIVNHCSQWSRRLFLEAWHSTHKANSINKHMHILEVYKILANP